MRYVSTRGEAPSLSFEDAMLTGLARDGGLYVPETWPSLTPAEIAALRGLSYEEAAIRILTPFLGLGLGLGAESGAALNADALRAAVTGAYAGFAHPARAPLQQLGPNAWVLELHRGPTLAFKDFAMQLIGRLFSAALGARGGRATIVGATSGDTGSAAIEAFQGAPGAEVFILYPHGKVSEVQRRQMTTPPGANVRALAIEGDFDACQALVKAMFNDFAFRDRVGLAAVNSINWARVAAQVVYYFTSAVALGAPDRAVSFSVPTGNFGDIFAGWTAKQMGLPIDRLIIATNENDILHRTMESGVYAVTGVTPTSAPSMDIQVSSNFERALFQATGRDAAAVRGMMAALAQSGRFEIPPAALEALRADFSSARVSESEIAETLGAVRRETGMLLDTHTAIGVRAAASVGGDPATPMVALGCAHAAKFPDAVERATGVRPPLPPHLADLYERPERMTVLPDDLGAVTAHIEKEIGG